MTSLAQLIIRVIVGGLLAGHGAQKLFGSFGGSGVEGTAGWMESMNLRPGRDWALAAGLSEFGGGILTALGALNPLGPIMAAGAMLMATLKVHHGKPIWGQAGGAELPVTNMAVLAALLLAGPGRFSVDRALGIRIPRWAALIALLGTIGVTVVAATDSGLADELEAERVDAEAEATPQIETDVPDAPEPSTLIAAG